MRRVDPYLVFFSASKASNTHIFLLEHPWRKLCFPQGLSQSVLHSLLGLASARSTLVKTHHEI